jgi:hypothetical protein
VVTNQKLMYDHSSPQGSSGKPVGKVLPSPSPKGAMEVSALHGSGAHDARGPTLTQVLYVCYWQVSAEPPVLEDGVAAETKKVSNSEDRGREVSIPLGL